jgi:tRNA pseudouridine55 synthase
VPKKPSSAGPHGVVVIDKPAGWTSHDVVAKSRGVLGTRKVGHSGTLDPDATGVLVLGVGHATRLLRFLTELPKQYEGEIVLGTETTTLDAAGEVTATHDMSSVTDDQVRTEAAKLTGDLMQVPPMVSAIKIDGKRLHELAREGKEVERPPRPVRVDRFTVEPVPGEPLVWRCVVECSSGTYIRSLAADLGNALGGGPGGPSHRAPRKASPRERPVHGPPARLRSDCRWRADNNPAWRGWDFSPPCR